MEKPINLINSDFNEKNTSITLNGKYLFFGSSVRKNIEPELANVYWVSTNVTDKLRPFDVK